MISTRGDSRPRETFTSQRNAPSCNRAVLLPIALNKFAIFETAVAAWCGVVRVGGVMISMSGNDDRLWSMRVFSPCEVSSEIGGWMDFAVSCSNCILVIGKMKDSLSCPVVSSLLWTPIFPFIARGPMSTTSKRNTILLGNLISGR